MQKYSISKNKNQFEDEFLKILFSNKNEHFPGRILN